MLLMALISQSVRDWFPSHCLRLCSPCLKEGWEVLLLVFFPASMAARLVPSAPTSHSRSCNRLFLGWFKSLPSSQQFRCCILSDHTSFFHWTMVNVPICMLYWRLSLVFYRRLDLRDSFYCFYHLSHPLVYLAKSEANTASHIPLSCCGCSFTQTSSF